MKFRFKMAERYFFSGGQDGVHDTNAIDEGPIGASGVFDAKAFVRHGDFGVGGRNGVVFEDPIVAWT